MECQFCGNPDPQYVVYDGEDRYPVCSDACYLTLQADLGYTYEVLLAMRNKGHWYAVERRGDMFVLIRRETNTRFSDKEHACIPDAWKELIEAYRGHRKTAPV
jgi:hypothetical protein